MLSSSKFIVLNNRETNVRVKKKKVHILSSLVKLSKLQAKCLIKSGEIIALCYWNTNDSFFS